MRSKSHTRRAAAYQLREQFSFFLKDLKIEHQSEVNNLNVRVSYEYNAGLADASYPDFRLIARDIEYYLGHYPNKGDYWEILNKNLSAMVLQKYRELRSITIEIQVSPTAQDPYQRASVVSRVR